MRLSVLCAIALLLSALPLCAQETATVRAADGFQYPVGPNGTGEGYYIARGYRPNGHLGEDWNGVRGGSTDLGDPVYATANGFVTFARNYHVGWGNVVIIRHAYYEGSTLKYVDSLYGHLLDFSVQEGEQVKRGQKIGRIGDNFGMYEAHLHFEMRKNLQIGMFRSSFARDFSNYYSPNEFVAAHRVCPSGNHMVSIPINTYPPAAPPVLAGPHVESPMHGPPSAGGSPNFIRIAPFPSTAASSALATAPAPTPTPAPKTVTKVTAPTPAPATPEPKIAKTASSATTPESSTPSPSARHAKSTAASATPTSAGKSAKKSAASTTTSAASPQPTPAAKGSKTGGTTSTASTKKGDKLPAPVAAARTTPPPAPIADSRTHKTPTATPTPQPTVATRAEPETIVSAPLFPTPAGNAPNTSTTPIRRSVPGYKVDRFEDLRGKAGY